MLISSIALLVSCSKELTQEEAALTQSAKEKAANSLLAARQESATFNEIASIQIGGSGAAEISAFDAGTKKLFVVNNSAGNNRIEVLDLTNPASPVITGFINVVSYGGFVNSVAVGPRLRGMAGGALALVHFFACAQRAIGVAYFHHAHFLDALGQCLFRVGGTSGRLVAGGHVENQADDGKDRHHEREKSRDQ